MNLYEGTGTELRHSLMGPITGHQSHVRNKSRVISLAQILLMIVTIKAPPDLMRSILVYVDLSLYKLAKNKVDLSPPAASCPPTVCVPVLLPLLTLMERSSVMSEGAELWETNDQGCDIMLRHLEAARGVAHNTRSYTQNAEMLLQGNSGDRPVFLSTVIFRCLNFAFFSPQSSDATTSCWRSLKRTSSYGCCGEAAALVSTNQIDTTSSTSSSLRCHGNWSRHQKPRR